jgi:hypothetical protein
VYLALYARRAWVIFDHPNNAEYVLLGYRVPGGADSVQINYYGLAREQFSLRPLIWLSCRMGDCDPLTSARDHEVGAWHVPGAHHVAAEGMVVAVSV